MAELLVFGENLKGINHVLCIVGDHWVVYAECIGNYCVECLPTRTHATYRKSTAHIGKGLPLIWYRVTRQQSQQGCPHFPLPRHFILLFREDSNVLPDHLSDLEDSSLSWIFPSFSSQWDVLETPPRVYRCPHLQETLFFHLYPAPWSFSHIAKFLALGEGRNVDWPVNRELHLWDPLLLYHDKPIQWPHYCGGCTYRPASLSLHHSLTRKQKWTALDRVLSWSIVP